MSMHMTITGQLVSIQYQKNEAIVSIYNYTNELSCPYCTQKRVSRPDCRYISHVNRFLADVEEGVYKYSAYM